MCVLELLMIQKLCQGESKLERPLHVLLSQSTV